jgi:putative phage-type endonuclease
VRFECADELTFTNEEDWLKFRKIGIGGSDVATIFEISKWSTPLTLWKNKRSKTVEKIQNKYMEWGSRLENIIFQKYQEEHSNYKCEQIKDTIFRSKKYPYMLANLDGIINNECILEIKTASSDKDWTNGVPLYYELQVQHYMIVTGLKQCVFAVLFGGNTYCEYCIKENLELQAEIIKREKEFFDMVQNGLEPAKTLEEIKPSANKEIELDCINLLNDYSDVLDVFKSIKKQKETIEKEIKEKMQDAELARIGNSVVTWKTIHKGGYTVKPSSYRDFRVKLSKEII